MENRGFTNLSLTILALFVLLSSCTKANECLYPNDDANSIKSMPQRIFPINLDIVDSSDVVYVEPKPGYKEADFRFPWQKIYYNADNPQESSSSTSATKAHFAVYKGQPVTMNATGDIILAGQIVKVEIPMKIDEFSYNDGNGVNKMYAPQLIPVPLYAQPGADFNVLAMPIEDNKIPSIKGVPLKNGLGLFVALAEVPYSTIGRHGDYSKWICHAGFPMRNNCSGACDNISNCADTIHWESCDHQKRHAWCSGYAVPSDGDKERVLDAYAENGTNGDKFHDYYERKPMSEKMRFLSFFEKNANRYQVERAYGKVSIFDTSGEHYKGINVSSGMNGKKIKSLVPNNITRKCNTVYTIPWMNLRHFALCSADYTSPNWATSRDPHIASLPEVGPLTRFYFGTSSDTCDTIDQKYGIKSLATLYGGFYNYVIVDSQVWWSREFQNPHVSCDFGHELKKNPKMRDPWCKEFYGGKERLVKVTVCSNHDNLVMRWPLQAILANIPLSSNSNLRMPPESSNNTDSWLRYNRSYKLPESNPCGITASTPQGTYTINFNRDDVVSESWKAFPMVLNKNDVLNLSSPGENEQMYYQGRQERFSQAQWDWGTEIAAIYPTAPGEKYCTTGLAYAIAPLPFASCFGHYRGACINTRVPEEKCIELETQTENGVSFEMPIGSCRKIIDKGVPIPQSYKDPTNRVANSLIDAGQIFIETENVRSEHCGYCVKKDLPYSDGGYPIVKEPEDMSPITGEGVIKNDSECSTSGTHFWVEGYYDAKIQKTSVLSFQRNEKVSFCPDSESIQQKSGKLGSLVNILYGYETSGVKYGSLFGNTGSTLSSQFRIPDDGKTYTIAIGYAGDGNDLRTLFDAKDVVDNILYRKGDVIPSTPENGLPTDIIIEKDVYKSNELTFASGKSLTKGARMFVYVQEFKKDPNTGEYINGDVDPDKHPEIVFGRTTSHDDIYKKILENPSITAFNFEDLDRIDGSTDGRAAWTSSVSGLIWIGILDTTPVDVRDSYTDGRIVTFDPRQNLEKDPVVNDSLSNVLYWNMGNYNVVASTLAPAEGVDQSFLTKMINKIFVSLIYRIFYGKEIVNGNNCKMVLVPKKPGSITDAPLPSDNSGLGGGSGIEIGEIPPDRPVGPACDADGKVDDIVELPYNPTGTPCVKCPRFGFKQLDNSYKALTENYLGPAGECTGHTANHTFACKNELIRVCANQGSLPGSDKYQTKGKATDVITVCDQDAQKSSKAIKRCIYKLTADVGFGSSPGTNGSYPVIAFQPGFVYFQNAPTVLDTNFLQTVVMQVEVGTPSGKNVNQRWCHVPDFSATYAPGVKVDAAGGKACKAFVGEDSFNNHIVVTNSYGVAVRSGAIFSYAEKGVRYPNIFYTGAYQRDHSILAGNYGINQFDIVATKYANFGFTPTGLTFYIKNYIKPTEPCPRTMPEGYPVGNGRAICQFYTNLGDGGYLLNLSCGQNNLVLEKEEIVQDVEKTKDVEVAGIRALASTYPTISEALNATSEVLSTSSINEQPSYYKCYNASRGAVSGTPHTGIPAFPQIVKPAEPTKVTSCKIPTKSVRTLKRCVYKYDVDIGLYGPRSDSYQFPTGFVDRCNPLAKGLSTGLLQTMEVDMDVVAPQGKTINESWCHVPNFSSKFPAGVKATTQDGIDCKASYTDSANYDTAVMVASNTEAPVISGGIFSYKTGAIRYPSKMYTGYANVNSTTIDYCTSKLGVQVYLHNDVTNSDMIPEKVQSIKRCVYQFTVDAGFGSSNVGQFPYIAFQPGFVYFRDANAVLDSNFLQTIRMYVDIGTPTGTTVNQRWCHVPDFSAKFAPGKVVDAAEGNLCKANVGNDAFDNHILVQYSNDVKFRPEAIFSYQTKGMRYPHVFYTGAYTRNQDNIVNQGIANSGMNQVDFSLKKFATIGFTPTRLTFQISNYIKPNESCPPSMPAGKPVGRQVCQFYTNLGDGGYLLNLSCGQNNLVLEKEEIVKDVEKTKDVEVAGIRALASTYPTIRDALNATVSTESVPENATTIIKPRMNYLPAHLTIRLKNYVKPSVPCPNSMSGGTNKYEYGPWNVCGGSGHVNDYELNRTCWGGSMTLEKEEIIDDIDNTTDEEVAGMMRLNFVNPTSPTMTEIVNATAENTPNYCPPDQVLRNDQFMTSKLCVVRYDVRDYINYNQSNVTVQSPGLYMPAGQACTNMGERITEIERFEHKAAPSQNKGWCTVTNVRNAYGDVAVPLEEAENCKNACYDGNDYSTSFTFPDRKDVPNSLSEWTTGGTIDYYKIVFNGSYGNYLKYKTPNHNKAGCPSLASVSGANGAAVQFHIIMNHTAFVAPDAKCVYIGPPIVSPGGTIKEYKYERYLYNPETANDRIYNALIAPPACTGQLISQSKKVYAYQGEPAVKQCINVFYVNPTNAKTQYNPKTGGTLLSEVFVPNDGINKVVRLYNMTAHVAEIDYPMGVNWCQYSNIMDHIAMFRADAQECGRLCYGVDNAFYNSVKLVGSSGRPTAGTGTATGAIDYQEYTNMGNMDIKLSFNAPNHSAYPSSCPVPDASPLAKYSVPLYGTLMVYEFIKPSETCTKRTNAVEIYERVIWNPLDLKDPATEAMMGEFGTANAVTSKIEYIKPRDYNDTVATAREIPEVPSTLPSAISPYRGYAICEIMKVGGSTSSSIGTIVPMDARKYGDCIEKCEDSAYEIDKCPINKKLKECKEYKVPTTTYNLDVNACAKKTYLDSTCWEKVILGNNDSTSNLDYSKKVSFQYPYDHIINEDYPDDVVMQPCDVNNPRPYKTFTDCVPAEEKIEGFNTPLKYQICTITRNCVNGGTRPLITTRAKVPLNIMADDKKSTDGGVGDISSGSDNILDVKDCTVEYSDYVEYTACSSLNITNSPTGEVVDPKSICKVEKSFDCKQCNRLVINNVPLTAASLPSGYNCQFADNVRFYCDSAVFNACSTGGSGNIAWGTNDKDIITVCNPNDVIATQYEILTDADLEFIRYGYSAKDSMKPNKYMCTVKKECDYDMVKDGQNGKPGDGAFTPSNPAWSSDYEFIKVCESTRDWAGGFIYKIYTSLTSTFDLFMLFVLVLILTITQKGYGIIVGSAKLNSTEAMKYAFTYAFITAFIWPGSWDFVLQYLVKSSYEIGMWVDTIVVRAIDPLADPSNPFGPVDAVLNKITDIMTWRRTMALFLNGLIGAALTLCILHGFFSYLGMYSKVIAMWLSNITLTGLYLTMVPIAALSLSYSKTSHIFKNFVTQFVELFVARMYLMTITGIFTYLYLNTLDSILYYTICPKSIFNFPALNLTFFQWWVMADEMPTPLKPYFDAVYSTGTSKMQGAPTLPEVAWLILVARIGELFINTPLVGSNAGMSTFFSEMGDKASKFFSDKADSIKNAPGKAASGAGNLIGKTSPGSIVQTVARPATNFIGSIGKSITE